MEQTVKSDVIVIDDDPQTVEIDDSNNDNNSGLEIQEDLLTLFYKCFPEPVIDLSDRLKDKKGTSCSNVRCKNDDEELVTPTLSAISYFNLPNKSLLLCKTCNDVADKFMKEMIQKYYKGESIFDFSYPPTNPVVVIDSDGSDTEESGNGFLSNLSEKDSLAVKNGIDELVKKHLTVHKLDMQLEFGKQKVEDSVQKLSGGYAKLITDTQKAINELNQSLVCLNETFAPKVVSLEPLDIPFEEMRPSVLYNKQKQKKLVRTSITLNNMTRPSTVPPNGLIFRPKPKIGDKFFVMKASNYYDWIPATVTAAIPSGFERQLQPSNAVGDIYRVEVDLCHITRSGNRTEYLEKEVAESCMAYFKPPGGRPPVGTRIIALFNNYSATSNRYLSGIVAELPCTSNKNRYLVFFDDGYSQYVHHEDIRIVVKSRANVSEYFSGNNRFIKDYLESYPERPMLKINVMDHVRVMKNGLWQSCRVIEVDASLIRLLFLKDNSEEWLYRGSCRLRPLYEHNCRKKEIRRFILPIGASRGPHVQYDLCSDSSDNETGNNNRGISSRDDYPDRNRRAVAKKSTTRLPDIIDPPSPPPQYRRYSKRVTRQYGKIETLIPSHAAQPFPFRKHTCSPDCVIAVNYDEKKTKGVNPLVVPTLFGFRRDSDMNLIFYISPCGKKLRTMIDVLKYVSDTKILIGVDHFDFDPSVHIFDEFIVPPQHILIKDLSHGRENVPIPVVNSINVQIPNMMEYMTERRGLEGVHLNLDENFLVGCDCTDNCQDKSKCSCQQMTINEAKAWSKCFFIDKPEQAGYKYRRLSAGLPSGIWECNNRCRCCKKTCLNRVAQYPMKVKLQLFKTKKKGWGVRCVNDVPSGTFICVYNGNILTEKNANEGGLRHGDEYFAELDYIECMEGTKANYEPNVVFPEGEIVSDDERLRQSFGAFNNQTEMNSFKSSRRKSSNKRKSSFSSSDDIDSSDSEEMIRQPQRFGLEDIIDDDDEDDFKLPYPSVRELFGKTEAVYVMDAKTAGNIGRYFNHSCDPNVHVQSVFVDTHDLRFPWIAFFSQKYIRAGTELSWDYRYEPGKVPGKKLLCYCEAPNCRKRLL